MPGRRADEDRGHHDRRNWFTAWTTARSLSDLVLWGTYSGLSSSIEPSEAGNEVDGGEEVARGLVVACCDGPELLHPGKDILDQMAFLVEFPIVLARFQAVGLRRDRHGLADFGHWFDQPFIGVERFVSDKGIGLHLWQELISPGQIMGFTAGQMESNRIAKCIDQSMDLGAQSAP